MDRKRWGPDVEYWLDSSNTCRPHLIPHHTLRATSGLLCHRDVLHGLHTLHTYPLCLTRVWGLLTGPLEISFNHKMTPNGQKRKKKKNHLIHPCHPLWATASFANGDQSVTFTYKEFPHMARALYQVLRRRAAEEWKRQRGEKVSRLYFPICRM